MNEVVAKGIFKAGAAWRNPGLINRIKELEETDFSTKEVFYKIQNEKLFILFEFLKSQNSYFASLIPENFKEDPRLALAEMPVIDKSFLLQNLDKLTNYRSFKKLILAETSGSTGEPFKFKKNLEWDTANRASFMRAYHWYGVEPWQRNGYFWGYSLNPDKKRKMQVLDTLQNRFRVFSYEKKELIVFLEQLKSAHYLHGYSSMIYEVANIALDLGYTPSDFPFLKMIKGTSEKIYPYYHAPVIEAFGRKIISEYGSAEAGIIAYECPEGHMHINEENVILEEIQGEAVVTNLNAYSLPIIRYKVGDSIDLDTKSVCACGRHSTIITEIQGRVGKKIYGKNSSYPSLTLYYIFKNISLERGVDIQYQAVQHEKGMLYLRLVRALSTDEKTWIQDQCNSYFGTDLAITLKEQETIHDKKGKLKDFVTMID